MNKLQLKMLTKQDKQDKAHAVINQFMEVTLATYGSHSYAAGYLGSKICRIVTDYLTKTQFAEFLQCMEDDVKKTQLYTVCKPR